MRSILFSFLLTLIFLIVIFNADAKPIPELMGLWLFEDGKGDVIKDSSGNGLDGKLIAGGEFVNGKFGKAIKLNGSNQCIEIPHADIMNITDEPITMLIWYKWDGAGDGWQTFFSKGPMSGTNENWALFINTGGAYFHFISTPNGARINVDSPGGVVKKNEWQFVAGTYDGKTVKIFLDGKFIKEQPQSGKLTPNKSNLRIGHREGSPHWWMGTLDEAAVFKKALSENELNSIMKNGLTAFMAVESKGKLSTSWGQIKSKF
ncbi:MAG: LamG domain-containing protein [bacterium]